jgi:tetratricopeptide (TPR) repeat protein
MDESVETYLQIIEITTEIPDVYFRLGNAYYQLEKVDDAIDCYQKALEIESDRSEVWYNLGNALCVQN